MNGILFKSEMTLANLNGLKNRTSRTRGLKKINENPDEWELVAVFQDGKARFYNKQTQEDITLKCPYGGYSSELYGKETYFIGGMKPNEWVVYRVDYDAKNASQLKWRSPMMMPEWASRYHIILEKIIVQRIQEITIEDIIKEGLSSNLREHDACCDLKKQWIALWDSINGKTYPWSKNCWVWGLYYRVVKKDGK